MLIQTDGAEGNLRGSMWAKLIYNYIYMNTQEKKKARKAYAKAYGYQPHNFMEDGLGIFIVDDEGLVHQLKDIQMHLSLADLQCTPASMPYHKGDIYTLIMGNQKDKEDTMYPTCKTADTRAAAATVNINAPEAWDKAKTAQEYLLERLINIKYTKYQETDRTFKLGDRNRPKTLTEFMDRLKKGDYKLDKDGEKRLKQEAHDSEYYEDDSDAFSAFSCVINFTHYFDWRTEPFDNKAWEAARNAMEKACDKAKDTVMVSTAEDGLKAVQEFEAATFA